MCQAGICACVWDLALTLWDIINHGCKKRMPGRECKKQISYMPCHYHKIYRAEVVGLSIANYPDIIIHNSVFVCLFVFLGFFSGTIRCKPSGWLELGPT